MFELPKGTFPEACAAPEAGRYMCDSAWFDARSGEVCATDGRTLVRIPVDHADEESGQIPTAALKLFRKEARRLPYISMGGVNGNGQIACLGITMPRDTEWSIERVPQVEAVTPKKDSSAVHVSLNVKLLANVAKALGCEIVRLQFGDQKGCEPVRVDPQDPDAPASGAVGVIMPISE